MILNSVEDALRALSDIEDGQTNDYEEIVFSGELSAIKIVVEGPRYKGTVPAELARGLWEFQGAIYRATAFALTGVEDIKKLNADQRRELELVFKVVEGSSDFQALLGDFVKSLGEGFKTLDPKLRARLLICFALLFAGGLVSWKILGESAETKRAEIAAATSIQMEQEKTRQFSLFAEVASKEPRVQSFVKAAEEGTTAIVKAVPDATSLKVGRVEFNRDEIKEVNQRSERVSSVSNAVSDDFMVYSSESKLNHATKFVLAGSDGTEFPVTALHSDFTADEIEKLWAAARQRTKVRLEVSITTNRGTVKAAQIIQFL